MRLSHIKFIWTLLALFALTLLPVLLLNFSLVNSSLNGQANTVLASEWQSKTHGVVSAPSVLENGTLKLLRLQDRLPEINTVILGSSTSYAIDQSMFPANMRIYNFSKNGVALNSMIGEADYLLNHENGIKWLVIPLDWSLGFIYQSEPYTKIDLSVDPSKTAIVHASWLSKVADAMSFPRISGLFTLLGKILSSPDKLSSFRQTFLQAYSDEYHCPDGSLAKDFDIQSRGNCRGYNFDGSWTFNSVDRVSDANRLIMLAETSNSKYRQNLLMTKGVPNPEYLQKLTTLASLAKQRGGGIIFFNPPLLSGMEGKFLIHPELSSHLKQTKQALTAWAQDNDLMLLDAGQSEKFGCRTDEFSDEHHATKSCYQKIFTAFWQRAILPDGKAFIAKSGSER